jgi:uncharacterized membrane protein
MDDTAFENDRMPSRHKTNGSHPSRASTETTALSRVELAPRRGRSASVGFGWFSIGLGLAEIVAPGPLARLIGVPNRSATRWILRALGVREFGAGLGLFSQPQKAGWRWARVAGDVVDLSLLGAALLSPRPNRLRTSAAFTAVLGVTALDAWAAQKASKRDDEPIQRSVTIQKPVSEVYAYWRELTNLPKFMGQVEAVEVVDARRSRWRAHVAAGASVSWDAELVEERPGELIRWRTSEDELLRHEGQVSFIPAPDGKSTEVHVCINYTHGQGVGAAFKSMLAPAADLVLGEQLEADLGRLKQLLQLGYVMRSDASIHRGMHPGRPAGHDKDQIDKNRIDKNGKNKIEAQGGVS